MKVNYSSAFFHITVWIAALVVAFGWGHPQAAVITLGAQAFILLAAA
jgi:hypothetical protein